MSTSRVVWTLAGAGLLAWLLARYGAGPMLHLFERSPWTVLALVLLHFLQLGSCAAGWKAISRDPGGRPSLLDYSVLRWLRESVNGLVPIGQVGGNLLAIRILRRRWGVPLASAAASCIADVTIEFVTQGGFTLLGVLVLFSVNRHSPAAWAWIGALAIGVAAALGLVLAQRMGLMRWVERMLVRFVARSGLADAAELTGLHETLMSLYRRRPALGRAAAYHLLAWLLGTVEVWLAMSALGYPVDLGTSLVIESLGQALRNVGFAIPGAIGVQEGSYVAVCALFGIPPQVGIALSVVKRVRELILGLPALLAWPWLGALGAPAAPRSKLPA